MGGGPCAWAAEEHIRAGFAVYATPSAARTFNDDLREVERMGVRILSEDEAAREGPWCVIPMGDLDIQSIGRAMEAMGVAFEPEGLAVALLDHGEAPPGVSDRLFRFDHLRRVVQERDDLFAFAYTPADLPPYLTRMRTLAEVAGGGWPMVLVDTGVAAALGALLDREVARHRYHLLVNLGTMHTLAFLLREGRIRALMEHHTGLLDPGKLHHLLTRLLEGNLTHEEVFEDRGHGVLYTGAVPPGGRPFVAVAGPRRRLMEASPLKPYLAAPFGDTMLTGCFGLVRAFAHRFPRWGEEIEAALAS
jgi:uncharacterized protein (DUF1786 family)